MWDIRADRQTDTLIRILRTRRSSKSVYRMFAVTWQTWPISDMMSTSQPCVLNPSMALRTTLALSDRGWSTMTQHRINYIIIISSSSSSSGLPLNGRRRLHEWPPWCRRLAHGKHLSWDAPPVARRANTVTENQKNSLESPLGRPSTPAGRLIYLLEAYTRRVTAPSSASEDFFMAAACATRMPHPRSGRAVAVGRRLLIRQGKLCLYLEARASIPQDYWRVRGT